MKIVELENLRDQGGVLAHGCWDLLHIGHIRHLTYAKTLGNPLIVTLTADKFITKGPGRPAFSQDIRAESLAALECVDYVSIIDEATGVSPILIIKPDLYVKGGQYQQSGIVQSEIDAVDKIFGKIIYTEHGQGYSSTRILTGEYLNQRIKECTPPE